MDKNNELLESNSSFIDAVDKMVYWSKLFGVLSLIVGILIIIVGIAIFVSAIPGLPPIYGLLYVLIAALYIYPGNLLLKFSKTTRRGLTDQNKDVLTEGFTFMGNIFTFWGTLTVIVLGLYALLFLLGFLGALAF
ncbi:MAG: hypothetical protein CL847_07420 [Crocinitomicaceae bacterium]|nr:hypothetical protein [Crocinitomicaceae bacterium]|tara:strand:+ start:1896 stop:2300 length:405 start_codon:yes stop_codon:yes gene_type:complete